MFHYLIDVFQEKSNARNICGDYGGSNVIQDCGGTCDTECFTSCYSMCADSCLESTQGSGGGGNTGGCSGECSGTCLTAVSIMFGK